MLIEFIILITIAILLLAIFIYARRRGRIWTYDPRLNPNRLAPLIIGDRDWHSLSDREKQVARRVAMGESNKEVGKALGIAPDTVGAHLTTIYLKMNVRSRTQLAARLRDISD